MLQAQPEAKEHVEMLEKKVRTLQAELDRLRSLIKRGGGAPLVAAADSCSLHPRGQQLRNQSPEEAGPSRQAKTDQQEGTTTP